METASGVMELNWFQRMTSVLQLISLMISSKSLSASTL
jgi:hypothetical protein